MLPQPIFLDKLMQFLSDEKLDINAIKKGIENTFSKKDFHAILELNIKIMGMAKLVLKSDEAVNVLLPQVDNNQKIKYSLEKLELEKEMDIDLGMLKDSNNAKLIDIIKQEHQENIIKELDISSQKEKIKILFIINKVPKSLKSIYQKCDFKDFGLANYLEFDEIWDYFENDTRYFAVVTSIGANKVKFCLENIQDKEDELNVLTIKLDKEK
ncbi:hypothetical protein LS70_009475 [Helicobacter sp. MIT 11-5569]|uniref:hypothetical protein n=1 Tax=Helicobacter sp. MIT 11-5569 TaxID=1548151 RepID=UPI00051FC6B8|nr:hypothetical protein [Helicobacter sp. MIT 11-5569]TLD80012.1 hypothetical protein LS70_009475 [Helicobacter sp. MIT 11-5569]